MRRFAFISHRHHSSGRITQSSGACGMAGAYRPEYQRDDPDDVPDIKVATVGKGFRVTGGPAGTFWNPTNLGKGNYHGRGTFTLMKPSGHVNYYGLVFGGEELGAAKQRYIYFLVAQDGTLIIRQRTGENVQDVHRAMHSAVRRPGADGIVHQRAGGTRRGGADLIRGQRNGRAHDAKERADGPDRWYCRRADQPRARRAGGRFPGAATVITTVL